MRKQTVFAVFIAAAVVAIIAIYAISTIGIFDHIPRGYNEGWNAYQVQTVLNGQPLYPSWDEPWVNNYPPLSFYVVAALSLVTHDVIVSGRLVSLAGILVTGFNVGAISAVLTRNKLNGFIAALFFLMAVGIWFQGYVAMNDPQWLGHAVQTTGALILLSGVQGRRSLGPVFVGAAMMFLGCIVKHNLVILPLTVWGVLFARDRKACLIMTALFVLFGCAFILFASATYGRPFFEQVLDYQRVMRFIRGVRYLTKFAGVVAPALVFALLNLALSPADWRSRFPSIYTLAACLLGAYALFGEGISYNILFDAVIAMALTVGSLFGVLPTLLESGGVSPAFGPTLSALLLFAPVVANLNELIAPGESAVMRSTDLPLGRSVVDALANAKGPVACEILAWCFWANKPHVYDAFAMAERAKLGGKEEAGFVDQIESGHYAAIETQSSLKLTEQKNRVYWDALTRNYQLVISEPTEVWLRKAPEDHDPQASSVMDNHSP